MPSRLQHLRAVLLDSNNCGVSVSAALCGLQVSGMVLPASDEVLPCDDHHYANTASTHTATQWLKCIRSADILLRSHLSFCGGQLGCKLVPGCLKLISVCSHCFLVYLALGELTV